MLVLYLLGGWYTTMFSQQSQLQNGISTMAIDDFLQPKMILVFCRSYSEAFHTTAPYFLPIEITVPKAKMIPCWLLVSNLKNMCVIGDHHPTYGWKSTLFETTKKPGNWMSTTISIITYHVHIYTYRLITPNIQLPERNFRPDERCASAPPQAGDGVAVSPPHAWIPRGDAAYVVSSWEPDEVMGRWIDQGNRKGISVSIFLFTYSLCIYIYVRT